MNEAELQYADDFVRTRSRTKAIQGLEGDSDQAAQAVRLSNSTGADPQMIYGNHENFTKDYKSFLTQRMLDRNPGLDDYINAHPMSAIVSKDDWNKMADFYDHLDYWMGAKSFNVNKAIIGGLYGAQEKFREALFAPLSEPSKEEAEAAGPYLTEAWKGFKAPIETGMQAFSALVHGFAGFGEGMAMASGASATEAGMQGRRFGAAAEYFTTDLAAGGFHAEPGQAVVSRMIADRAFKLGEPYLKAGELPPPGIHPVWDGVIRAEVERKMSVYDALVDVADKAATKEISPDLMQIAAAVKVGNEQIYIHWDAVKKLYGEKVPEPGDGLLGDVPGFIEQYQKAIDTATDIQVPLATWLSKIDPEVVKTLHDDIRFRPGDPTLKEVEAFPKIEQAMEEFATPPEAAPAPTVEEPPLERLSRLKIEYADRLASHGAAEHLPGKDGNLLTSLGAVTGRVYNADNVSQAMRWAFINRRPDIVERAMELARHSDDPQLLARLGTELENLNKHADAQNAVKREMAQEAPFGWEEAGANKYPVWSELLRDPNWKKVGEITAVKGHGDLTAEEAMIKKAIGVLFERLGGPQAGVRLVATREARMGLETPYPVTAAYVMAAKYGADVPTIAILLGATDPAHSLGHEFMHHLRRYNFLTEKEWAILSKRAESEWVDKHRIRERYDETKPEQLIEEGVAEGFGEWYSNRFINDPEIHTIFQKIADFIDQLRVALKELFGRDLTPEEIFEKIYRGEVARREPTGPPDAALQAKPLEREAAQRPEIEVPKIEAEGLLGILPKGREQRYLNLINKQNAKDVQKLFDQAYKDELKRQKPEWQKAYADQYAKSIAELKDRPDFRAAAFFRSGIIGNQKLEGLPKIDPTFLTPEQRAALPEKWLRQRDGFAPNDIAGYLGYRTGEDMISDLIRFEEAKGRMRPETFLDLQAAAETERIMERQYGNLDENVLREAREHAIGLERFDLLHEETLALAAKLGQEFTLTKQDIRDQAALNFTKTISSQVSLIKYTREIGRSNRAAEDAWLKGDALGAYTERQRTLRLQAEAEHAKRFEKDKATWVRNRRRFSKREVSGVDQEYTNWIHHILNRTGDEVRSPIDLETEINAHNAKTLQAFLDEKSGQGWLPEGYQALEIEFNPQIPVWEDLINPDGWNKHIDAATVGEFRAVNESVKALIKAGREELRGILEGQAFDRKETLDKMVDVFSKTGIDKLPPVGDPTKFRSFMLGLHRMKAGLLQMQYIWGRLDQSPYGGIFYKHFTKPFLTSGNEYRLLIAEYGKKLNKIKQETSKDVDLKTRNIPNDVLFEPIHGLPDEAAPHIAGVPLGGGYLTRAELRAVMLNLGDTGNKRGNLSKLTRGYGADPELLKEWVNKHATQQDWDYVQRIWKLFEEIQNKDDIVSRNISGIALERLPYDKIQTAFGDIPAGYFPMIYDQSRGGGGKAGKVDPNLPTGIKVLTDRGFELQRTGYAGPVSLALGTIESQLTRRLRNIAFREVLTETQKFFRDDRFQKAMTRHLGQEYTDLLMPYLRDIAGVRGPLPKHTQQIEKVLAYITQNAVVTFVGLNPSTLAKHNFTAFFQSFKEIKDKRYLASAVYDLFNGVEDVTGANREFVQNISAEIKGRRPNWMEALGGETDVVTGEQTLRSRAAHVMSWPIAKVDQGISMWLWYAKYREAMDEIMPTAKNFEHARTEAIAQADIAVVRTHGSTAITSRPAYMRQPMLKPFVALYGFFNHIFNRMYEISWEARKHKDLETGEAKRADAGHLASQIFWAVVPAAIVEELVTPLFDKDDRSWATRFLFALGFPITSSVPWVRELAHALFTGHDPGFGIVQGSMKTVTDLGRLIQKGPDPDKFGDQLQAMTTLAGAATGIGSQQLGRWNKFMYNYFTGRDKPVTKEEWYRAIKYGTSKERRRH